MLDSKGFDEFALEYDDWANDCDKKNVYPFAGYKRVLDEIYKKINKNNKLSILDLGFGTAVLTERLYKDGHDIYGQDFSEKMIELAQAKMPKAHLYKANFNDGLVSELKNIKYDYIIATYALHHLNDEEKIIFIKSLFDYLKNDGKILIGDISFETRAKLEECKKQVGDEWDNDEIYIVGDEIKKVFNNLEYTPISFCGGVFVIKKQ